MILLSFVNEHLKYYSSVRCVTAFNDSWHFLLTACDLLPGRETMRGTDSCCELTGNERGILGLCRLETLCLYRIHFADQCIRIYVKCMCVCVRKKQDRGVWLPPAAQWIGDKMVLKRLVLNMQPTLSAIFSRLFESDSVSALFVFLFCAFM